MRVVTHCTVATERRWRVKLWNITSLGNVLGCGSVAEWLACWTQAQKARVQIAVATLSGNNLRQTVHTHRASVHQAAKLVADFLRVAGGNCSPGGKYWQPTAGFMTHVTCGLIAKNRDQLRNPTLGNRVWATFTFRPKYFEHFVVTK